MKKVTNKILWLFAFGQLGWSILSGIITNWFVYFYAPQANAMPEGHTLFVPAGAVFLGLTVIGLISAGGRILDAVTDPWIASKSDALSHKDGRRIPFMKWSAIPYGIMAMLLFWVPVNSISGVNSAYLTIIYFFFYVFMTLYCTPYNALIPVLGKDEKNKTKVSTYISLTFIIGTTFAFALPNIAGLFSGLGYTNSFRVAVVIMSSIAIVCLLIPALFIKEKDFDNSPPVKTPTFASLSKTFKNKDFRIFVMSDMLYYIAITFFNTGVPFYITSLIGLEESMTFVLIAVMTACSLVFYPFIGKILPRFGKKKMVIFAFFFFSVGFLYTTFTGMLGLPKLLDGIILAVLASLPMAILGILPSAMIADIAQSDAIQTNENREGMFFAARTFSLKMAQTVSMLLFTSVKLIGEDTNIGLRLTALIAFVFCILGAIVLLKYNEKKIYKTIGI